MLKFIVITFSIVFMWYFGGMYHQPVLIALSLIDLFALIFLHIIAIYCRDNIEIGFENNIDVIEAGSIVTKKLIVTNNGVIPLSRLAFRLDISYENDTKKKIKHRDYVIGALPGKNQIEFNLIAPYSGLATMKITRIWAYDYISSFSSSKKYSSYQTLVITPSKQSVENISINDKREFDETYGSIISNIKSDSNGDFSHVREFHNGDLLKNIHWKLSAKSNKILIKEYDKENGETINLYLDLSFLRISNSKDCDNYYRIVYSIETSLLQNFDKITLHYVVNKKLMKFDLCNDDDCVNSIIRLITTKSIEELTYVDVNNENNFIVNNLEVYQGSNLIYKEAS